MLARVISIALDGVQAQPVEVEVDLGRGLPALNIVGLAEGAVREAKDRVRAAMNNSGFSLPTRRITINLAPADLPKGGSGYDLPMALGLLAAAQIIPEESIKQKVFLSELSLDGRLKPVPGCLPAALFARKHHATEIIVPPRNADEAALAPDVTVVAPKTLLELVRHLRGEAVLPAVPVTDWSRWLDKAQQNYQDMADVKGQEYAKRALEVAAAGGHNIIMSGPPGSGKTFLSRCMPGLLPDMTLEEALEVTAIYSVAGQLTREKPIVGNRPFRSPHHTATRAALIGGGSGNTLRPGEVSLAHRGILFLDEIPEFGRPSLEVMREPLEGKEVTISRAARTTRFPAHFQLIAACNPCPCGHLGNPFHPCSCSQVKIERYRARLSGPLMDRIDLHVEVPPVPFEKLVGMASGESTEIVRHRVIQSRAVQYRRNGSNLLNRDLEGRKLDQFTKLGETEQNLLLQASQRLNFSARAYHRILRVARTIADLDNKKRIEVAHLSEAIQYRVGGRFFGGEQ
ncbi:YifB family Mg chelatase-like AAA ATPase [Magnetococcales bacterium HHB-1]